MSEAINQTLFFIWYILTRPSVSIYRRFKKYQKPHYLLRMMIFVTVCFLFKENLVEILYWLRPDFSDIYFIVFATLTVTIYIWKNSDSRLGETWKKEYYRRKAEKAKGEKDENIGTT